MPTSMLYVNTLVPGFPTYRAITPDHALTPGITPCTQGTASQSSIFRALNESSEVFARPRPILAVINTAATVYRARTAEIQRLMKADFNPVSTDYYRRGQCQSIGRSWSRTRYSL